MLIINPLFDTQLANHVFHSVGFLLFCWWFSLPCLFLLLKQKVHLQKTTSNKRGDRGLRRWRSSLQVAQLWGLSADDRGCAEPGPCRPHTSGSDPAQGHGLGAGRQLADAAPLAALHPTPPGTRRLLGWDGEGGRPRRRRVAARRLFLRVCESWGLRLKGHGLPDKEMKDLVRTSRRTQTLITPGLPSLFLSTSSFDKRPACSKMNDNHKETSWDWRWKRGNGSKQKAKELTSQEELFNRQAKTERAFRPSSP